MIASLSLSQASILVHRDRKRIRRALQAGAIAGTYARRKSQIERESLLVWNSSLLLPAQVPAGPVHNALTTAVAEAFSLVPDDLYGRRRIGEVAQARHIACAALRHAGWRPSHIGRHLDRNHSTVLHSIARVARVPEHDAQAAAFARDYGTDPGVVYAQRCAMVTHMSQEDEPENAEPASPLAPVAFAARLAEALASYPATVSMPVAAYVRATLLHHSRAAGTVSAQGLYLLTRSAVLRACVCECLTSAGYGEFVRTIANHAARCGYRLEEAS